MFTFSMRRTWNVLDFSWLSVELLTSLQAEPYIKCTMDKLDHQAGKDYSI